MKQYEVNYNNVNEVKKILQNYCWVSFDIFDTLIKRKVHKPQDVFKYIENKYHFLFFKKRRILAQFLSYKFYDYPNIYDIYRFFLGFNRKKYINIELQTEKELMYPNPIINELYQFCRESNKNIIITSDMYIPKKIMIDYLKYLKYDGYKKIYISCEVKRSKARGNIYNYILKDLDIEPQHLIHIGDNLVSDIMNAKCDTVLVKD